MANLPSLTDENFEAEVDGSELPVLVDFGAEWCMPCRALAPTVEAIAEEYTGRLKVGYVDIDKAKATATRFKIMSVPTLVIMKGGEEVARMNGVQKKAALEKRINELV